MWSWKPRSPRAPETLSSSIKFSRLSNQHRQYCLTDTLLISIQHSPVTFIKQNQSYLICGICDLFYVESGFFHQASLLCSFDPPVTLQVLFLLLLHGKGGGMEEALIGKHLADDPWSRKPHKRSGNKLHPLMSSEVVVPLIQTTPAGLFKSM